MFGILFVGGMFFLVVDILVALIVLGMQQRSFDQSLVTIQQEHQVQEENTHELEEKLAAHNQQLEEKLAAQNQQLEEKLAAQNQQLEEKFAAQNQQLEEKLAAQSQQLQQMWHTWQASVEALAHQQEVAHLPRLEDFPLPPYPRSPLHRDVLTNWRPARFFRANLNGHDLSRRYLGRADLREAQLAGANFYMADLSGACLVGANLAEAELSGANLSGADLRNATLTNANLLVADLHGAVLTGANLLGVRNLSSQQICSVIFDNTTQLNAEIEFTVPSR